MNSKVDFKMYSKWGFFVCGEIYDRIVLIELYGLLQGYRWSYRTKEDVEIDLELQGDWICSEYD